MKTQPLTTKDSRNFGIIGLTKNEHRLVKRVIEFARGPLQGGDLIESVLETASSNSLEDAPLFGNTVTERSFHTPKSYPTTANSRAVTKPY